MKHFASSVPSSAPAMLLLGGLSIAAGCATGAGGAASGRRAETIAADPGDGPASEPAVPAMPAEFVVPAEPSPRLIRDGDRWFVTGLREEVAMLVDRGRLLLASRPIPGTTDARKVAVLRSIGRAGAGTTIEVAVQCVRRGDAVEPGMDVRPVYQGEEIKVGQCLGRVVDEGTDARGPFLRIDIGHDDRVEPYDLYAVVGEPLVDPNRQMPLVIGSLRDRTCHVSSRKEDVRPLFARCDIVDPSPAASQIGRHVLYIDPIPPG